CRTTRPAAGYQGAVSQSGRATLLMRGSYVAVVQPLSKTAIHRNSHSEPTMKVWPAVALIILIAGCRNSAPPTAAAPSQSVKRRDALFAGKLIDLTHSFDAATIYWPTEQGFRFERGNNGVTPKGYYYAANRFATAEHGGTHLDAPIHFAAGQRTTDQIELE